MSNYKDCMCRVCEQKRVAAAEVDKLKGMMIKRMSADHEKKYDALDRIIKKQEDVKQLKADHQQAKAAAEAEKNQLIADLQAKILKQDKQFAELAKEKNEMSKAMLDISNQALKDVVNAAGATIADLQKQLTLAKHEKEFWRLRAEKNSTTFQPTIHISKGDPDAMRKITEQLKNAFPLNGGCV